MPAENQRPDLVHRFAQRLKQQAPTGAPPTVGQLAEVTSAAPMHRSDDPPLAPLHAVLPRPAVEPAAVVSERPVVSELPGGRAEPPVRQIRIDLKRLQRLGFAVPNSADKTLLSEELRLIKRPLLQKAFTAGRDAIRNGNVIMVTSARPNEGKTFTAVNLALSMATERGLHVMLVDSDSHTQAVLNAFGVSAERGLVDVLLDEQADLADVILRTNIANFSLIPAGPRHPLGPELLASQRMARITEDMASRYPDRIIIIDSSPVLASSEPSMLAAHVGQVIFVVEQNRTPWTLVDRALNQLQGCTEISFVLNKVDNKLWEEDYASHYISRTNDMSR